MRLDLRIFGLFILLNSSVLHAEFKPFNFATIPPQGNPALRDFTENIQKGMMLSQERQRFVQESEVRRLEIEILKQRLKKHKGRRIGDALDGRTTKE